MPIELPPGLQAIIRARLGQPQLTARREIWTTSRVAATPHGFVSLKQISNGNPAQLRRVPRNWHQEQLEPGNESLLLPAEVIARELSKFRCDPAFRGDKRVPLRALARYAGVGKTVMYAASRGQRISNRSRLRLSLALRDIMSGRLRFKRHGQGVRFEPNGST